MAPRKTAASPKPDKLMRDALLLELMVEVNDGDGTLAKRLRKIARALITKAEGGDVQAIKEIADRTDGRPAQSLTVGGDADNPLQHRHEVSVVFKSAGPQE